MPSIFISYRREDTSGEAGRLAEDLESRFGRAGIFMDVDSISPGVNFEDRIDGALAACQVALVLIGDRWLSAQLPDGQRRLDDEADYVRHEIAAALSRADVTVVPVLVEGARMPSPADLPPDISGLAKINAFELSNKRWDYDLGQLCDIAERYEGGVRRVARNVPRWAWAAAAAVVLAAVVAAIVLLATGGSTHTSPGPPARRAILVPATVPPKVDECATQLRFGVDGTAGPLKCPNGDLNSLAWQYYAKFNLIVMALGPRATPGQVDEAICSDLRANRSVTIPKETDAIRLATLYYGWSFALTPGPVGLRC
ncbi:MAG: hypothetical protein QOE65_2171 [Solirubrobacteraceae bacterium]|jgi:hypothetical protein|nr:hypothetical protein [Solirubrobacteraceae bacterium]